MQIMNDNTCAWINDLAPRTNIESLQKNEDCGWLIIGASCYNGAGIGVGTLFGEQIAFKASNENSDEINIIESKSKPTRLPPQPFLDLGIKTKLIYERFRSKSVI